VALPRRLWSAPNARLRDELLNETLFTSLAQVRAVLAAWRNDYNDVRPHGALANLTPHEYAGCSTPGPQWSPLGLECHRDSSHCWMKRGAQATDNRCRVNSAQKESADVWFRRRSKRNG